MKLKAITPQYVEGRLVPPGKQFETTEADGARRIEEGGAKPETPTTTKTTKAKASAEAAQ